MFIPIGLSISIGLFIDSNNKIKNKGLGRKIGLSLVALDLLIFLGIMQHENLQIEETVFYFAYFINTGLFTRVLVHYAIAKVFGPLIWGRGYCGWGCYTAALLEWLPIKENKTIPKKYTYIRIVVLILSLLIPFIFIKNGYDYVNRHIFSPLSSSESLPFQPYKVDQFIWFLAGNIVYYIIGIMLAIIFKKKRAFCKIWCPVALVMKLQSRISLIKIAPSGNKCIECGNCNEKCPMDIDVRNYIKNGKKILSSECILCGTCVNICPAKAIK
ncbi:4Fe-4S ferredoxin iron-sulfur binding domain protein [Treponema primitia ZAS-2]|uniref:4Fe-4S ferredoxin iron-sulfur binding domain protein n=1 Tax=Treponema primitia (strain ATCC BAA-887 / DSM 12427 / ZAS-2) TaxID=545694 RepID=F5YPL5_TREPZ|nr:4Fe-4S ferredoxin iron-sulfur binding domain protein [Treponema primitia ZAS-2]